MPDFPKLPIITPPGNKFPELPVITPDPPRLSLREKYGALYYLGIAGLAISITLVAGFAYGVWALRDVWSAVYVLHHEGKPEADRIRSAWAIAPTSVSALSREACSADSTWASASFTNQNYCYSTNRRRASTRNRVTTSSRRFAGSTEAA